MDPLAPVLVPLQAFDRFQQRQRAIAFPIAVIKKYGDDQGGNLVSIIVYRAFFSSFPLLLAITAILGYVLHSDAALQQQVVASPLERFPVIGTSVANHALHGSVQSLIIGVVGSV